MSGEQLNRNQAKAPQIELFNSNGEPTDESQGVNAAEVSPSEEFSQLTNGQNPSNYGLDTEVKIKQFLKDNRGESQHNIMFALTALSKAIDDNDTPAYSWQNRRDLR